MKRKPIDNPDYWMEGLCRTYPPSVLVFDEPIDSDSFICIDNKPLVIDHNVTKTINELVEQYRTKLNYAESITVQFESAFHDETYEYNKEDGKWYLVDQGKGYA